MKSTRRSRLRRGAIVPLTLAAVVLVAGAAFAASQLTANSGTFLTASSPNAKALGTGEALAIGAPDAVSVGVSDTSDASWSAITGMSSEASGLGPVATAVAQGDTQLVTALIDNGSFGNCSAVGPFWPPAGMTPAQARFKVSVARSRAARILASDRLARRLGIPTPKVPAR